ncbi:MULTISPECIES: hypothetical protein [Cysteiniphilum]|uniref:Uncharacterized protein n=1 Tax=Cysteiniphilum litorale TaxID=2056700 RepID=A0A8J3EAM9_9GAMM|nr:MULTISPECIES: hypothetical protein [Cysteiniphilum]GGG07108.1 hypothetical protein GCM10010995_25760 [Cysteiniphilum litorale]
MQYYIGMCYGMVFERTRTDEIVSGNGRGIDKNANIFNQGFGGGYAGCKAVFAVSNVIFGHYHCGTEETFDVWLNEIRMKSASNPVTILMGCPGDTFPNAEFNQMEDQISESGLKIQTIIRLEDSLMKDVATTHINSKEIHLRNLFGKLVYTYDFSTKKSLQHKLVSEKTSLLENKEKDKKLCCIIL